MIDGLAAKLANGIKKTNPEKTASVEVMQFALIILINGLITFVLALLIGFLTGKFVETVLILLAFILLRFVTGGFHFDSSIKCTVVSTGLAILLPHVPITFQMLNLLLGVLSLILILMYAPANIEGHTRIPPKFYPHLKVIALILVSSNFIIGSPSLSLGFFVQSLTLVNFTKRR